MSVIVKHFLRPIIKIIEPFIKALHPGSLIYFQFQLQGLLHLELVDVSGGYNSRRWSEREKKRTGEEPGLLYEQCREIHT